MKGNVMKDTSIINKFNVCPGVIFELYDIYTDKVYFMDKNTSECDWSLRLDYCFEGRLEAEFTGKKYSYIESGQIAVNTTQYDMISSTFPLKVYKGFSILLYQNKMDMKYLDMLRILNLDFYYINAKVDENAVWLTVKIYKKLELLCLELMEVNSKTENEWIWIKITEFLYLVKNELKDVVQKSSYFTGETVYKIKTMVNRYIEEHNWEVDIKEFIMQSDISVSAFYKLFKKIYGTSPAYYFRDYRMNEAAVKLTMGNDAVQKIALETGYMNFSKFSAAFKRRYGKTPSEYRKSREKQSI